MLQARAAQGIEVEEGVVTAFRSQRNETKERWGHCAAGEPAAEQMAWRGRLQEVTPGCLSESGWRGCSRWREQRACLGGRVRCSRAGGHVVVRSQITKTLCACKFLLSPELAKKGSKVRNVLESKFPGSVRSGFKGAILGKRKAGRNISSARNKDKSWNEMPLEIERKWQLWKDSGRGLPAGGQRVV